MHLDEDIINWLLMGDPAIRFQTLKDLKGSSVYELKKEQERITREGWGKQILDYQDEKGTWANGLYSPKWISTTYTLLLLRRIGLGQDNQQAKKGAVILLNKGFYKDGGINFFGSLKHSETCVTGMVLSILCYFRIDDHRIDELANFLFTQQMADGGWNCQSFRDATHSSFHTTISVLEGLWEYEKTTPCQSAKIKESRDQAVEFLLQHRLYKSDKTGKTVDEKMTRFAFPPRWRYDVMRALDFLQEIKAHKDKRFKEAIDLLIKKRTKEGYWRLQGKHSGRVFFDMEIPGGPSRWNTLRALRILKWWDRN